MEDGGKPGWVIPPSREQRPLLLLLPAAQFQIRPRRANNRQITLRISRRISITDAFVIFPRIFHKRRQHLVARRKIPQLVQRHRQVIAHPAGLKPVEHINLYSDRWFVVYAKP